MNQYQTQIVHNTFQNWEKVDVFKKINMRPQARCRTW